ncbi:hypothetical protein HPB51_019401 [Rhipicephalus microplus]|uniref:Uncharacterized protein n=1 Tax=Rhipicephalus microplus TaxID=6941 RepID=A0A9J6DB93_RHIMP|nr:hypothetical protein HPB51_019401 [Rhipicephalus microplus]
MLTRFLPRYEEYIGPAGSLLQSAALPGALAAAAACLLLALSVACLLQRRRRKTEDQPAASEQGAYERLDCSRSPRVSISVAGPNDRTPSPTSRRSLRRGTNEPHFYGGCIAQERPIDFVVPTLAGSSLCGSAASLMSDASSTVAEPFGPPCSSPGDPGPVSLLPVSKGWDSHYPSVNSRLRERRGTLYQKGDMVRILSDRWSSKETWMNSRAADKDVLVL